VLFISSDGRVSPSATFGFIHATPPTPSPLEKIPLREDAWLAAPGSISAAVQSGRSEVRRADVFGDGSDAVVLQNALVRLVIAPAAGARAFTFEDLSDGSNVFTSVGAMRDDVTLEPAISRTDYLAKFTHDFSAGMFNRPYRVNVLSSGAAASLSLTYFAPDVLPKGAMFERTVTLLPDVRYFTVDERVLFADAPPDSQQRAVSVTSFGSGRRGEVGLVLAPNGSTTTGNSIAVFFPTMKRLALLAWRQGDVDGPAGHTESSTVFRVTLASGKTAHFVFASSPAETEAAARTEAGHLEALAQGQPPTPANSPP
jgi:hypothetical protein